MGCGASGPATVGVPLKVSSSTEEVMTVEANLNTEVRATPRSRRAENIEKELDFLDGGGSSAIESPKFSFEPSQRSRKASIEMELDFLDSASILSGLSSGTGTRPRSSSGSSTAFGFRPPSPVSTAKSGAGGARVDSVLQWWLEGIGLSCYTKALCEAGYTDMVAVKRLRAEQDFEELGVDVKPGRAPPRFTTAILPAALKGGEGGGGRDTNRSLRSFFREQNESRRRTTERARATPCRCELAKVVATRSLLGTQLTSTCRCLRHVKKFLKHIEQLGIDDRMDLIQDWVLQPSARLSFCCTPLSLHRRSNRDGERAPAK